MTQQNAADQWACLPVPVIPAGGEEKDEGDWPAEEALLKNWVLRQEKFRERVVPHTIEKEWRAVRPAEPADSWVCCFALLCAACAGHGVAAAY